MGRFAREGTVRREEEQRLISARQRDEMEHRRVEDMAALARKIGDVDLMPTLTVDQIKRKLASEPEVESEDGAYPGRSVFAKGLVVLHWRHLSLNTTELLSLEINRPFSGSIGGVHIGDSLQTAFRASRASGYPNAKIVGEEINLDSHWSMRVRENQIRVSMNQ